MLTMCFTGTEAPVFVSVLVLGFFSLSTLVNCYYQVEVAVFVLSFVSKCFVVYYYVSLKLTPQGFINLSCQMGLGARGLYSRSVFDFSGEAADKKKKNKGSR